MTTETMKQNLINSIIDEDADNPYKKQLLEIMKNHDEGKLTDIESCLLINETLVNYDFNVVMPMENEAIREKREIEDAKTYELVSDIPIQNPDDTTEVAIKTKTKIGKVFLDGYNELFNFIGIENLGIKDRKGDLLSELKGGKQKSKAQQIIKQYTEIIKKPDSKRYAIQIADIFEFPHYTEKEDGRGKSGFYIEHLLPIMVYYLLQKNENVIYTNVEELS